MMMEIVASKGLSDQFPENTLASFKAAIEQGVRHIEFSVHLTRDDQVVVSEDPLISDRYFRRNYGGSIGRELPIMDLNWDQLDNYRCVGATKKGSKPRFEEGELIPLLFDVLQLSSDPEMEWHIQIKYGPQFYPKRNILVGEIMKVLSSCGIAKNCVLGSADEDILQMIKSHNPEQRVNYLFGGHGIIHSLGKKWKVPWSFVNWSKCREIADDLRVDYFSPSYYLVSSSNGWREFFADQEGGPELIARGCQNQEQWEFIASTECFAKIVTEDPLRLKTFLSENENSIVPLEGLSENRIEHDHVTSQIET